MCSAGNKMPAKGKKKKKKRHLLLLALQEALWLVKPPAWTGQGNTGGGKGGRGSKCLKRLEITPP